MLGNLALRNTRRGVTHIGSLIIAIAFLIALMIALTWIMTSQKELFEKPNVVAENATFSKFGSSMDISVWFKNYGIEQAKLERVYLYDVDVGKYYVGFLNNNTVVDSGGNLVGRIRASRLTLAEGERIQVYIELNTTIKSNLVKGLAVFDKSLAPFTFYQKPPLGRATLNINSWRIKVWIFNPSNYLIFSDNTTAYPNAIPALAIVLITKSTPLSQHFFNWSCGTSGGTGKDVLFTAGDGITPIRFYRYVFDCTHKVAIFLVYMNNTTIYPRQVVPIYMYYGPTPPPPSIPDYSDPTVLDLFLQYMGYYNNFTLGPPDWDYSGYYWDPDLEFINDNYTSYVTGMNIRDPSGVIEDLNLTCTDCEPICDATIGSLASEVADIWCWNDTLEPWIECDAMYYDDWACGLVFFNTKKKPGLGDLYERWGGFWKVPEGYVYIMEAAINYTYNITRFIAEEGRNFSVWITGISTTLYYRALTTWPPGRSLPRGWYGWFSYNFGVIAGWNVWVATSPDDDHTPICQWDASTNAWWCPKYWGLWWIESFWHEGNDEGVVWSGYELKFGNGTPSDGVERFVLAFTSGADIIGTQYVIAMLTDSLNVTALDEEYNNNNPPPPRNIRLVIEGAYGDELIDGQLPAIVVIDTTIKVVPIGTRYYIARNPNVIIDWIRVLVGLGWTHLEGPEVAVWPPLKW